MTENLWQIERRTLDCFRKCIKGYGGNKLKIIKDIFYMEKIKNETAKNYMFYKTYPYAIPFDAFFTNPLIYNEHST